MKILNFALCFIFPLLLASVDLRAQISSLPSIKISGEVATAIELNINDITKLPHTDIIRKDKDGTEHTYSGVLLSVI